MYHPTWPNEGREGAPPADRSSGGGHGGGAPAAGVDPPTAWTPLALASTSATALGSVGAVACGVGR